MKHIKRFIGRISSHKTPGLETGGLPYGIQRGNVPPFPDKRLVSVTAVVFIVGFLLACLAAIDGNERAVRQDNEFRNWAKHKVIE